MPQGTWKYQSGAIELAGHNIVAGAELLKAMSVPLDGCATAGQYRFEVNGTQLRLSVIGDACAPRLMFLDRSRWAPPGEPNLAPPRTVTRTMFDAAVRLPRAADRSGNWPSFRGPQAAGVADGQQLPDSWNGQKGENILWRTSIPGLGHSSPIVWGDRLFVTSAISSRAGATFKTGPYNGADASDDTSSHQWVLYALDIASGRIVWQKTAYEGQPRDKRHVKSTYASSTPATDGRVVVAWFGSQGLHAYTVEGTPLWKVDLGRVSVGAAEAAAIEWGPASSPVIWEGLVIVQVDTRDDSFLIALSVDTGEQVWKTNRDDIASWSSPTVVTTAKGAELIVNGGNFARGYDPRTGSERWRIASGSPIAAPTPIGAERRLDRHQRRYGIVTPARGGAPRRRRRSGAGRSCRHHERTVASGLEREKPRNVHADAARLSRAPVRRRDQRGARCLRRPDRRGSVSRTGARDRQRVQCIAGCRRRQTLPVHRGRRGCRRRGGTGIPPCRDQ